MREETIRDKLAGISRDLATLSHKVADDIDLSNKVLANGEKVFNEIMSLRQLVEDKLGLLSEDWNSGSSENLRERKNVSLDVIFGGSMSYDSLTVGVVCFIMYLCLLVRIFLFQNDLNPIFKNVFSESFGRSKWQINY